MNMTSQRDDLGTRDCRGRIVGDRSLQALKPPLLDSPATVGFYDDQSGACFSSDCFVVGAFATKGQRGLRPAL